MKRLACAILRAGGPDPAEASADVTGGPPLERVEAGGLAVAFARVLAAEGPPGLERLRWYAAVVEALHRRGSVLPLRYGCLRDSEAELHALLLGRRDAYLAALDAVDGCDEMGVRVLIDASAAGPINPPAPASRPRGGVEYLAARRAELARADAARHAAETVATELREAFAGHYRESRVDAPRPGAGPTASVAFLVPRDRLEAFREAFRAHQGSGGPRALLSGPWPPYSFADVDGPTPSEPGVSG